MAAKQLIFSEEARRRLQAGIDIVANAVGTTSGPRAATSPWTTSMALRPSPTTG